jgi:4'-phosphopantetheinyl transferase
MVAASGCRFSGTVIGHSTTHLWLCPLDETLALSAVQLDHLSSDEFERLGQFVFPRDRARYATTRLLIRDILSGCLGQRPEDLRFVADMYGRPQLQDEPSHSQGPITFNISHAPGLIAVAIRRGARVGVDVESLHRLVDVARLGLYLSPTDLETFAAVSPDRWRMNFLDLWTLKESYIKARGLGLRIPLQRFGFQFFAGNDIKICFDSDMDDTPSDWHFWQCHWSADYVLAVCTDLGSGDVPALVVQRIAPFGERQDTILFH